MLLLLVLMEEDVVIALHFVALVTSWVRVLLEFIYIRLDKLYSGSSRHLSHLQLVRVINRLILFGHLSIVILVGYYGLLVIAAQVAADLVETKLGIRRRLVVH